VKFVIGARVRLVEGRWAKALAGRLATVEAFTTVGSIQIRLDEPFSLGYSLWGNEADFILIENGVAVMLETL
jgi:hypothetical protein